MNRGLFALLIVLVATFGAGIADIAFSDVIPIRPYSGVFLTTSRQIPVLENLIDAPLFPILTLLVVIVIVSIVAGIALIGSSSSAGLVSFRSTLSSFTPLFGLGIAVGFVTAFLAFGHYIKRRMNSG